MDIKLIIGVIVFVILLSFQYTLNEILKELKEIKNMLKRQMIFRFKEEEGKDESD